MLFHHSGQACTTDLPVCIGDDCVEENDDCVEFANNIVAVIREGALIAVWAEIKEV